MYIHYRVNPVTLNKYFPCTIMYVIVTDAIRINSCTTFYFQVFYGTIFVENISLIYRTYTKINHAN